jgi:hypothetical protein
MFLYTQPDETGESAIQVTANGTGDYALNYQLRESGWIPYSIKVGDKWYSYQYTPLIFALAPLGFLRDAEKYQNKALDDKGVIDKFMYANAKLATIFSDMTFLSSVANLMTAVTDDRVGSMENYFQRLNESTIKSFVQPNLVSQLAKDVEAYMDIPIKDVKGLMPTLLRDTPIARDKYYNKVNVLGEDVIPDNDIFIGEKKEVSREWKFINETKCFIPPIDRKANQIFDTEEEVFRPMTDDEFYNFSKRRGQLIKEGFVIPKSNGTTQYTGLTGISGYPYPIGEYETLMLKEAISELVQQATRKAKVELFSPEERITKPRKIKMDAMDKYKKEETTTPGQVGKNMIKL